MRRSLTLSSQLVLLQVGIVLAAVGLVGWLAVRLQEEQIRDAYQQQVLTVAQATARLPSVVEALRFEAAAAPQPLYPLLWSSVIAGPPASEPTAGSVGSPFGL